MFNQTSSGRLVASVVIPTHNRATALQTAVQSVLAQTYQNFEIVVVDDSSTDDTAQVVARYADPRIRYERHDLCLGGSAARNTGIRAAKGSYVAFLDDDDRWLAHKLERQLGVLASVEADAVVCASHSTGRGYPRYPYSLIDPRDLRRGNIIGGTSTFLVRRNVAATVGFDDTLPCGQDWDFLVRLASGYRVAYLDEPLVIYNDGQHSRITNAVANMDVKELDKRMRVTYKHKAFLGRYWFNYRVAKHLLAYPGSRRNLFSHLLYTIRRCGMLPVLGLIAHKIGQRGLGIASVSSETERL